ncbi:MAG: hypothetical protein HC837_01345 [Chloroflexaceae bacterium]|nr:hypothetical protein [Chloroflexaceae bacterium]
MSTHTIHVSEAVYRRLSERAAQFHLTPEQLIERLLLPDLLKWVEVDEAFIEAIPSAHSGEALAAVQRLTTCFADVTIPDLEQVLTDPLIALANLDQQD